jgi:SAM-dependent methyltransferase
VKESEIRIKAAHDRYLKLLEDDAVRISANPELMESISCPVCAQDQSQLAFTKAGFNYVTCEACMTLYASPRPTFEALIQLYRESESTAYWVNEFFKPVLEVRRERIFRPRAEMITRLFPDVATGTFGDVGAGFGILLEELSPLWPDGRLVAIEPSKEMANLCRAAGLEVAEEMLESLDAGTYEFDLLTAFELFEHLQDPRPFFESVRRLLKPGGHFLFTTLSGTGFDIQLLWEKSRSVSPPHHLNFANPFTIDRLLKRTGFELVDASTPGVLDWDIVDGCMSDGTWPGERLWDTVNRFVDTAGKENLQSWISSSKLSSHMQIVARAV